MWIKPSEFAYITQKDTAGVKNYLGMKVVLYVNVYTKSCYWIIVDIYIYIYILGKC